MLSALEEVGKRLVRVADVLMSRLVEVNCSVVDAGTMTEACELPTVDVADGVESVENTIEGA